MSLYLLGGKHGIKPSTVQLTVDMDILRGYWYNTQNPDIKSNMSLIIYEQDVKKEIESIIADIKDIIDPKFVRFIQENFRTCRIKMDWEVLNMIDNTVNTYIEDCYLTFGVEYGCVKEVVGVGKNTYKKNILGKYFLLYGTFDSSTKELKMSKIFYKKSTIDKVDQEDESEDIIISDWSDIQFEQRKRKKTEKLNINDTNSKSYCSSPS